MNTREAYESLLYPNRPYSQSHPDRLAVLARLHGMNPPSVETARVLDIGASEGGNIIPMAATLPNARFTGVELAPTPVERGNQVIRDLGLANVRLLQMDLLEMDPGLGEFDYIIAHGLYAWLPAPVREKLLDVARAHLSPSGVMFISYNTYPGGHLRKLLREAMVRLGNSATDPRERIAQARVALRLVAAGRLEPSTLERAIAVEAAELLAATDSTIFHDYLAPVYEPAYFRDFVNHIAHYGLQYLDDASVTDTANPKLPKESLAEVEQMAGSDRIAREQYFDLLRQRSFRQSLICRAEAQLDPEWSTDAAVGLFAGSSAIETADGQFANAGGTKASTTHEGLIAYLRRLIALWPQSEPIAPSDAGMAVELFRRGMAEIRATQSLAVAGGTQPIASSVARYQAERNEAVVVSLHHRGLELGDEAAKRFLGSLDGSRGRDQLAKEFECTLEEIDRQLQALSRAAMLVA